MKILKVALGIIKNNKGFWSGFAGAAAAGLGSLIGSGMSSASSVEAQKEANKLTRELYYQDREWNKPINQIARLNEAGLNPNLVYGNGGAVAGNTSKGAPRMESTGGYDLDFASAINAMVAAMNVEKIKAEKDNTVKDGELIDEKIKSQKIQNRIGEHDATIIEHSPVASTDKGLFPSVTRTISNVAHNIASKSSSSGFKAGVKNVINRPLEKSLTNTSERVNIDNKRSVPWFMKYAGKPWFMKF